MARWIVDGMNVIGSRPDGWWRDRNGAVVDFAARLGRWAKAEGEEVVAVFDGEPPPGLPDPEDGIRFVFAGRGASADDVITLLVASDPDPASLRVVTSDGGLLARVRSAGAGGVVGAGTFRRRLERAILPAGEQ